jgi:hypothetical protein
VVAAAVGIGALIGAGPAVGVVAAAAVVAADRSRRAARVLRWGPAVALATAAGYIIGRQAISRPTAAFEWPAEQSLAHQPALAALALLVAVVVVDHRRYRPDP